MRLLDASDDDVLGVQSWGEHPAERHWVAIARSLRARLEAAWASTATVAPASLQPSMVTGLVCDAIRDAGGTLVEAPSAVVVSVGGVTHTLGTAAVRLDLAAYDPDEWLRVLIEGVLSELPEDVSGAGIGALVTVLHYTHATGEGLAHAIQRFRGLPLAAVERLAPRGLRMEVFPPWAPDRRASVRSRPIVGATVLVAFADS